MLSMPYTLDYQHHGQIAQTGTDELARFLFEKN